MDKVMWAYQAPPGADLILIEPGMLVLLDRAFDGNAFLREVAATGALLVAR